MHSCQPIIIGKKNLNNEGLKLRVLLENQNDNQEVSSWWLTSLLVLIFMFMLIAILFMFMCIVINNN